ncbi:MAG: hypothetical protein R8P61_08115 [Bacteroidia bacterium]|nr:hypothetical protein [Bacteroidia bacterium]
MVAPTAQTGVLRLDNYVAIGDGYSAGFGNTDIFDPNSNIGLHSAGQLSSFPELLVNQFNQATFIADFRTELLEGNGSGYYQLEEVRIPVCTDQEIEPVLIGIEAESNWEENFDNTEVNNLSVPRLRLSGVENPQLNNAFFQLLRQDSTESYLDLIEKSSLTFFTLYLGSRDLLDYAMRGGADPNFPLIPSADFINVYAKLLRTAFLANPDITRGVVGKIPDISEFPFFTSIGPLWRDQTNCNITTRSVYIQTRTGSIRTARETDRILLPTSYLIGQQTPSGNQYGLSNESPIPEALVLDSDEVRELKEVISEYNVGIDSLVMDLNNTYPEDRVAIARVDVLVQGLTIGLIEDGLDISTEYLSGGFFSLDGLYLTPRGNALLTNEFVKAINGMEDFGAIISPVNVISYSGVVFP